MKPRFSQLIIVVLFLVALFPGTTLAHETEQADDGDFFTIVWVSDTQDMAYRNRRDVLEKMGQWIIRNRDALRIRYVVQTGDAVDNGASPWQWEAYDFLLRPFQGKIPYIAAAGNHEVKKMAFWNSACGMMCGKSRVHTQLTAAKQHSRLFRSMIASLSSSALDTVSSWNMRVG